MQIKNLFRRKMDKTIEESEIGKKSRDGFYQGGFLTNSLDLTSAKHYTQDEALQINSGWIYGIVNLIAGHIGQSNYEIYYKKDTEEQEIINFKTKKYKIPIQYKNNSIKLNEHYVKIFNHPVEELLHNVNNHMDGFGLFYITEAFLDLCGNAYWLIIKDEEGIPQNIEILSPLNMKIIINKSTKEVEYYQYQDSGTINYNKNEIVHIKYPSVYSNYYGVSPFIQTSNLIDNLTKSENLELGLLKNAGVPPMILTFDGNLTPEEIKKLEDNWRRATTGNRQGNVKVLDNRFEVQKIALSIEELLLKANKILDLKGISFAFGVPYSLIDTTEQKKAGLDQILEMLAKNCLQPRLNLISEAINQQLLPLYDESGNLKMVYEDPSPDNPEKQSAILNTYVSSGILSINEARAELGLPPKMEYEKPEKPEKPEKDEKPKPESEDMKEN